MDGFDRAGSVKCAIARPDPGMQGRETNPAQSGAVQEGFRFRESGIHRAQSEEMVASYQQILDVR
jgi:hypothetical protein